MVRRLGVRGCDLGPLRAEAGVGPSGNRDVATGSRGSSDPHCYAAVAAVGLLGELRTACCTLTCDHHGGADLLAAAGVDPGAGPVVRPRAVGHHAHVVGTVRSTNLVAVDHVRAVAAWLPVPAGCVGRNRQGDHRRQGSHQRNEQPCKLSSARHCLTTFLPVCFHPMWEHKEKLYSYFAFMSILRYFYNSSGLMRFCSVVSRLRTVTVPSSSESKSITTQ
jgi:hypothetical protein